MKINIHTHIKLNDASGLNELQVVDGVHSKGLHPWSLTAPFELNRYRDFFTQQKKDNSDYVLIGECGLDRKRQQIAPMDIQEAVLIWHLEWATECQKPIVIHCVGAYSDLLKILKQSKFSGKILIHDYSSNLESALQLLKFETFFSFGKSLFRDRGHATEILKSLPLERVFLETDNQNQYSLAEVYQKAALTLGLSEVELEGKLMANLLNLFSDLHNVRSPDIVDYLRGEAFT